MWGMLDRYTDKGGIDTLFNRQTKDILIRLDSVFKNIYKLERKHTIFLKSLPNLCFNILYSKAIHFHRKYISLVLY